MEDTILAQDNRITTARYELTLLEKRIMYFLLRDVRNKFVLKKDGEKTLFDDLIIQTTSAKLRKDLNETNPKKIKDALKSLRMRSFEWHNGTPEDSKDHQWFETGFINYGEWKNGGDIEFQVSKKILPFFVELTSHFTEYSSLVAISLKSKWSQRFYELCCQYRSTGGLIFPIKSLRRQFALEDKYKDYSALKLNVISVAHKELKELFKKGECDVYFEFSELKNGRSVESLKMKILGKQKDIEYMSNDDLDYYVRTALHKIFDTKNKAKNKEFIGKTMTALRLDLDKMKHCYKRLETTVKKMPKEEQARYLRYIINEDYLTDE